MPAFLTRASSQALVGSSPPVIAAPFSVGFRCMFTVGGNFDIAWSLADSGSGNNYWAIGKASGGVFNIWSEGGASNGNNMVGSVTLNAWHYVVFRAISATNRRTSVFYASGAEEHVQNTTSITPSGVDTVALGVEWGSTPLGYMNGKIDEYWMVEGDIQRDGGQLDGALLRQLARQGPRSVPHMCNMRMELLCLKDSLLGDKGDYYSDFGRRTWTNQNGVKMAA